MLIACSVPVERPILTEFFAASRLRDRTRLQQLATVIFEPTSQGIVSTFEIIGVSTERRTPLARWPGLEPEAGGAASPTPLSAIELSLADPRAPLDHGPYDGELVTKDVTITAPVRLGGGQVEKTLIITMERASLREPKRIGRWVITEVR